MFWSCKSTPLIESARFVPGSVTLLENAPLDSVNVSFNLLSGRQTGADRAPLDFPIGHGVPHGGWCPKGRRAEDGQRLTLIVAEFGEKPGTKDCMLISNLAKEIPSGRFNMTGLVHEKTHGLPKHTNT